MRIFNRDFCTLTKEEMLEWDNIKEKEVVHIGKTTKMRISRYSKYPVAIRHYLSLFPNNHLDVIPIWKGVKLVEQIDKFTKLINDKSNGERGILNFIKDENAYTIVGSILGDYNFGHHSAYIFPEFQLGVSYKADYLLIGKNSGGYEFIFIEFESPSDRIVIANGDFGESIRKGLSQINDWDTWLEENFNTLSEIFGRLKNPNENLPNEFYKLDKSRIHYVVVVGRREHYKERTYRLRRKEKDQSKINLLHYDNLIDFSKNLIGKNTY